MLYQSHRLDPFLPIRFVGNRFIMYSFAKRHFPAMQTLFSTWFYGSPIELEDVGNQEFLGFLVSPSDRAIQIIYRRGRNGKYGTPTVLAHHGYCFLALDLEFAWQEDTDGLLNPDNTKFSR